MITRRMESTRYDVKIPLCPWITSSEARTTQKGSRGSTGRSVVSCARPYRAAIPAGDSPAVARPLTSEPRYRASFASIVSSGRSQPQSRVAASRGARPEARGGSAAVSRCVQKGS